MFTTRTFQCGRKVVPITVACIVSLFPKVSNVLVKMWEKWCAIKILKAFSLESEGVSTIENIHLQVLTLFGIFDGHDKLKPYGFSIHGGINGFSRRVLWLEVSTSNKMPEVIAKYDLDAVKRNGLPVNVKADDGIEHTLVQPIDDDWPK